MTTEEGNMKYTVIHTPTNKKMFEADTKIECRDWIRMGDRDGWHSFVCVDESNQPVKLWGLWGE